MEQVGSTVIRGRSFGPLHHRARRPDHSNVDSCSRVRVFRYRRWCAVCPCCDRSLAYNQPSWRQALGIALKHVSVFHPAPL